MTVKNLIDHLTHLQPDMQVLVDGYESGYTRVKAPFTINVSLVSDTDWWDGEYEKSTEGEQVLILPR
jgi:hypothetical protein